MTTQRLDILEYDGELWKIQQNLLRDFMGVELGKSLKFKFTSTDCWRGYVSSWAIREGQLYFVDIEGRLEDGRLANFAELFPRHPNGIPAKWVNQTIQAMKGKVLAHESRHHGAIYESVCDMRLEHGILIKAGGVRGCS
ncbi:MAG: hypothetical protein V4536_02730 [Pseudomonadota bacterium]